MVFNRNARGRLQVEARTTFRNDGFVTVGSEYGTWLVGESADNSPPVIERFFAFSLDLPYFSIRAGDPDGLSDIADVSLDIRSADESKQCGVAYSFAEKRVTLWSASGVRQGASDGGPLENEYCTVFPSLVNVFRSPTGNMSISVRDGAIVFSQDFAGAVNRPRESARLRGHVGHGGR